jgi:hypothetical protein
MSVRHFYFGVPAVGKRMKNLFLAVFFLFLLLEGKSVISIFLRKKITNKSSAKWLGWDEGQWRYYSWFD